MNRSDWGGGGVLSRVGVQKVPVYRVCILSMGWGIQPHGGRSVSLNDEDGRKLPISDENGILKCPFYLQTFTNPDWTNNNSESGNHVMKLVAGWKPQQLLDLVDMLHSLTQQQFGEVVKVFAGRGEFALAEKYLQYNMDHQVWASKSRDAQQRHVKKFIEARKPAPTPGTARSTDGKLLINVKKTAGKKPHQKQRPKANRTRTISQSNNCYCTNKHLLNISVVTCCCCLIKPSNIQQFLTALVACCLQQFCCYYFSWTYLPYALLDFHETKAKMCVLKLAFQQYIVLHIYLQ